LIWEFYHNFYRKYIYFNRKTEELIQEEFQDLEVTSTFLLQSEKFEQIVVVVEQSVVVV